MKVKTDHPNYLKDLDNKALLANDLKALHKHRKKISEVNKGRVFTEEHKAKLRAARAKQVISDETKEKMKQSQLKRWKDKKENG